MLILLIINLLIDFLKEQPEGDQVNDKELTSSVTSAVAFRTERRHVRNTGDRQNPLRDRTRDKGLHRRDERAVLVGAEDACGDQGVRVEAQAVTALQGVARTF